MRGPSLIFAAAIVVIANALALLHVTGNRAGTPTAEIELTNRELRHFAHSGGDEDSGVTLVLQWTDLNSLYWPEQAGAPPKWLDRQKLQKLGFDCSVNPESSGAANFYGRQRPRRAFVAMEYDGPAWQAWGENYGRPTAQAKQPRNSVQARILNSHLLVIDADLDRDRLRARHPDRGSVLILPAVVAITLDPFPYPNATSAPQRGPQIGGRIQQVPSSISVPRPFSDEFRHPGPAIRTEAETDVVLYRVRLCYGAEMEPWVSAVEFTGAH